MAGAGYKLFNTGDVLTAAQVNTYLQEQTVMVFASSAARTSALSGVLAEGMVSYLQDTNAVEVYNGSAWVGVSGAGDVTEVQAGTGISVASGTGPIPVVTNTMATAVDAKGDLIVGTGADTFARLAVGGTNGHSLQVDSSTATGLKWAAAAGGSLPTARGEAQTQQNVAANTTTKVTLGTEIWDTDSNFATSRFTATTAGYYQVNSLVALANGSTAGILYNYIHKNGTLYQANYTNTMLYAFCHNSTMVYLAVNDYVELFTSHNVSGGENLYGITGYVFMDVTGIRS